MGSTGLMRPHNRAKGPTAAEGYRSCGIINDRVGNTDIAEGVIDVGARHRRSSDICHLAGEGVGAAEAIDLPYVGRAERLENDLISLLWADHFLERKLAYLFRPGR